MGTHFIPDLCRENELRGRFKRIAGIDEAGRGPLAGPVSAAAVVLPEGFSHSVLTDSKKLSERKREQLFEELMALPGLISAVEFADPDEITEKNILGATTAAMERCALRIEADYCLIDGRPLKKFAVEHEGIIKGDSKSLSIAAASILAKVTRDRLMIAYDTEFPEYGFAKHKGYGTAQHLAAIRRHGPCPIHRLSFQPLAQMGLPLDD